MLGLGLVNFHSPDIKTEFIFSEIRVRVHRYRFDQIFFKLVLTKQL
jgi:hypothetical protein